jgi:hypothetical protein
MCGSFAFAPRQYRLRDSLPRVIRVDKEGTDSGRISGRIDVAPVSRGVLVSAEKRSPAAPAAAPGHLTFTLRNEVRPVLNEIRVNAEHGRNGGFDLCVVVMLAAQATGGLGD